MTDPEVRRRPWRVLAAATALIAPVGALYAFSVFLQPLEALLGVRCGGGSWGFVGRPASGCGRFRHGDPGRDGAAAARGG